MKINNKMKAGFIIILFVFTGVLSNYSQELPKILPPSPEVYEFTKYGDININEATGFANIQVPVTTYSLGRLSVPIHFNYTTSGIKVNQLSSWVGMGWTLTAGGIITRTVRDIVDEEANSRFFPTADDIAQMKTSTNSHEYYDFIYTVSDRDTYLDDTEPDIYNFNFAGYSGSFIIDGNGNYKLLKAESNMLITKSGTGGFILTAPGGLKYYFNVSEITIVTNSCSHRAGAPPEGSTSSWFLNKIEDLNGDQIFFTYKNAEFTHIHSFSQSITVNTNIRSGSAPTCGVSSGNDANCFNQYRYATNVLEEITNNRNDNKVVFNSVSDRHDVHGTAYRLTSIALKDNTTTTKEVFLDQENILSNKSWFFENSQIRAEINRKRLFLNRVFEKIGAKENNVFEFEYNNPQDLPPRLSYSQDGLGFYNGITSKSMIPGFTSLNDTPSIFRGRTLGNRNANFNYVTKGILQKVVYPTKGETIFEYEPSVDINTNISNFTYQTLELEAIIYEDPNAVDQPNCYKELLFEPAHSETVSIFVTNWTDGHDTVHDRSLIIIKDLTTDTEILNLNLSLGESTHNVGFSKGHQYKISVNLCSTVKFDHVKSKLRFRSKKTEIIDGNIGYSGVRLFKKTNIPLTGIPNVIKYYYTTKEQINNKRYYLTGFSNNHEENVEMQSSCNYVPGMNSPPGLTNLNDYTTATISSENFRPVLPGGQLFYRNVTIAYGEDHKGGIIEKEFEVNYGANRKIHGETIKNANITNLDINNGRLLKEAIYKTKSDRTFSLLEERLYNYNTSTSTYYTLDAYSGNTRYRNNNIVDISNSSATNYDATRGSDMSTYKVNCKCNELNKVIEKKYLENKVITTETKFYYENNNCNVLTRKENVDSRNKSIKTINYYPDQVIIPTSLNHDDLQLAEIEGITKLKTNYQIFTPIQVEVYEDNSLITSQRTNYTINTNSGLVLPKNVELAKANGALKKKIVYHDYDRYGNPIEVSKKDGIKNIYVWGYNKTMPIAKITNATFSEVNALVSTLNLLAISNADNDRTMLYNGNEGNLRRALDSLRNNLPNTAEVTTYTYDPLIGITSITDARGKTTYFEYDSFNRLKTTKDAQGKLISDTTYHYKNQQ